MTSFNRILQQILTRRDAVIRSSERGVSTVHIVTALAIAAAGTGVATMNTDEAVGAAETTTCQYERTVIETALDTYAVTESGGQYPMPSGADGLDDLRSAHLLRKTSVYWHYDGADANGELQFTLLQAIPDCE